MNTFHLDKGTEVKFDFKNSKVNTDASEIFESSEFEDHLAICATSSKIANTQSKSLRKRIVEILKLIETQLEKN